MRLYDNEGRVRHGHSAVATLITGNSHTSSHHNPANTPANNEGTTRRVAIASTIAISGGRRLRQPNEFGGKSAFDRDSNQFTASYP